MTEIVYEVKQVPVEPGRKITLHFTPSGEHIEYDHVATRIIRKREDDRVKSETEIPIVKVEKGREIPVPDLAFERGEVVVWRGP